MSKEKHNSKPKKTNLVPVNNCSNCAKFVQCPYEEERDKIAEGFHNQVWCPEHKDRKDYKIIFKLELSSKDWEDNPYNKEDLLDILAEDMEERLADIGNKIENIWEYVETEDIELIKCCRCGEKYYGDELINGMCRCCDAEVEG